ncbi:GFA family protein [Chelativorans sp.]|uniref:GFA family protein n=1 Tax=Chelativorans sp. TaxID=2203393 RepID=UPI002811DF8D|nr:GFA family protein [Chelativorans sp.]
MLYKGGCHCGKVSIEVEGDLEVAVSCNCSICSKKGALLWAVPRDKMTVAAETEPSSYLFHRKAIAHRFCPNCGMHVYAEDAAEGGERTAYINIRCLEAVEIQKVPVIEFDGRAAL